MKAPVENDVANEQDLLVELRNTLSEFTAIGDEVVAVDPMGEPSEQLENVSKLSEKLHHLNQLVENVEKKLQAPQGTVLRPQIDEKLSDRVSRLQQTLEAKKQELQTNAKLQTLTPAIDLLAEDVRLNLEQIEQSLPQTMDEQNLALSDLESRRQQLERLIEGIPDGAEGEALRGRAMSWLDRLNDQLKRLAALVGEKLAALAAFNANKDEVQAQLASIQLPPTPTAEQTSVPACNDQLQKLKVMK